MITYDMSQLYESRHVKEFLGINKNQLFHWIQTKKLMRPAVMGEGRGRRTQFSLDDLLTLTLIKSVYDFGIELNTIKKLMGSLENVEFPIYTFNELMKNVPFIQPYVKKRVFRGSIWDYYRADREHFNKVGYSLEISRGLRRTKLKDAFLRGDDGKLKKAETKEERERLKIKLDQTWRNIKTPPFSIRAIDGESQTLLLSSGINPSEKGLDRDDFFMPSPSSKIVIIINLLNIIQNVRRMTKRPI
jgi:DNA-binding transcriptional MerR regulator